MRLQSLITSSLVAAAAASSKLPSTTTTQPPACTATSHTGTGGFFDLRADRAVAPGENSKWSVTKDYFSKGYDYGKNFTLNICGSVVDSVTNVVGVDAPSWQNVSAYYISHGEVFSIGLVLLGH